MRRLLIAALAAATGLLYAGTALAQEHEFVGAKKCRSCHVKEAIGDQYTRWEESKHAEAFQTLATEQAKKWAAERGIADPQTADECVKCHSTAHDVPDDLVSRKFDRQAGVQCEACHGPGKSYRKKKIMVDRELSLAKGLVPQDAKVCVTCHNDESPAWDPERYTNGNGERVGFDYDQAVKQIPHPVKEGYDPFAEDPE